jgi:hypothetical protein
MTSDQSPFQTWLRETFPDATIEGNVMSIEIDEFI